MRVNKLRRNKAAVIGAIRILRGWFQRSESGLPAPQRQAQAARDTSSNAPSITAGEVRSGKEAWLARKIFPVANSAFSLSAASIRVANHLGSSVTSLFRIAIHSDCAA